ncbi:putative aminoglycoside phosphotransferase [Novosphingobium endophyticum]|uniref:Aminoglycoside phosphotransferase n=1 Tax=Novosphingobium endophyticum TaxID=1955250 RepID=A0A916TV05_9SPHN|nr:aminoglycoside phosphotransferase family protein [Novosphingobium endophyticum]GGC01719.1 putative aminoglycoside phosphotransferase [Novosphingobium endophyticum]
MGGHFRPCPAVTAPAPELDDFLYEHDLASDGEDCRWAALTGGVSSEIWRVTTPRGEICVKRALAKLRVASNWEAPVDRNAVEWNYLKFASGIEGVRVPRLLAHDEPRGLFAMEFLPPEDHPVWKAQMFAGHVDQDFARDVGRMIAAIHSAGAHDAQVPERFATETNFEALRIDPYLLTTARAHPDLAPIIADTAHRTLATKCALVHGDVSPKNILCCPDGPVLIDAETAWFGDPAFDLAFCLNHLAIKARVLPGREALVGAFAALSQAYLENVDWEHPADLEARAAPLLAALALARVDGKSPLEYLSEDDRLSLRKAARECVGARVDRLSDALSLLIA